MTETEKVETSLTTRHFKAASLFGGTAVNVPKARCTAGRLRLPLGPYAVKPAGCACCAGQKLCECNSLETVCPDVAADFGIEENGDTAAEVTKSASAKYSWPSDEPGAKKRSVAQRTLYRRVVLKETACH